MEEKYEVPSMDEIRDSIRNWTSVNEMRNYIYNNVVTTKNAINNFKPPINSWLDHNSLTTPSFKDNFNGEIKIPPDRFSSWFTMEVDNWNGRFEDITSDREKKILTKKQKEEKLELVVGELEKRKERIQKMEAKRKEREKNLGVKAPESVVYYCKTGLVIPVEEYDKHKKWYKNIINNENG